MERSNIAPLSYYYLILFITLSALACKESPKKVPQLTLDRRYSQVNTIHAIASCQGPQGAYSTEVQSSSDGHMIFTQVFDYRDDAFIAQIDEDGNGTILDTDMEAIDTMPAHVVEMIRSHDMHRMHIDPNFYFRDITYETVYDSMVQIFIAYDALDHPVTIYYDRSSQNISQLDLINPTDTTEMIQIKYLAYRPSGYGDLADEVAIIQDGRDTFLFRYQSVEINR